MIIRITTVILKLCTSLMDKHQCFKKPAIQKTGQKFNLTARQYGEVVLPDAASGNCPGTRRQASHITVPAQGGYGAVFAILVQGLLGSGAIAVQCWLIAENMSRYCYFVNNPWRSVAVQG
jgi:hypothetical protein